MTRGTRTTVSRRTLNGIAQTPDGYLWIATQEGLARFDGVTFTLFDSRNTRVLFDNFVFTLATDRRGTLWMGASGGIVRYDGNAHFKLWSEAPGWSSISARSIAADAAGRLWVGDGERRTSGGKGLVRFHDGR
jgi:ligand-binding sensor domain-containing protein